MTDCGRRVNGEDAISSHSSESRRQITPWRMLSARLYKTTTRPLEAANTNHSNTTKHADRQTTFSRGYTRHTHLTSLRAIEDSAKVTAAFLVVMAVHARLVIVIVATLARVHLVLRHVEVEAIPASGKVRTAFCVGGEDDENLSAKIEGSGHRQRTRVQSPKT